MSIEFGKLVRKARGNKTQADVTYLMAKPRGIDRSQPWVSQVENGRVQTSMEETIVLAWALGIDMRDALEAAGYSDFPTWARRLETEVLSVENKVSQMATRLVTRP